MHILIPQDVINHIVDELKGDKRTLATGSLVSKSFHEPCRRYLFARIELDTRRMKKIRGFYRILAYNPEIGSYVRHLHLVMHETGSGRELPPVLQSFAQLQSLCWQVAQMEPLPWSKLNLFLKTAVVELLQSSSLVHIDISHVKDFPISLLAGSPSLKELTLSDVFPPAFIHHEVNLESKPEYTARIQSLVISSTLSTDHGLLGILTQLLPSIELSYLRYLRVGSMRQDKEIEECQRVMEFAADSLEDLILAVKFIVMTPVSLFNLRSLSRLRRLSMSVITSPSVFQWLHSILRNAADNVLEQFKLSMIDTVSEDDYLSASLAEVDEILTSPTFGHLHTVSLFFDSWHPRPPDGSLFVQERVPRLVSRGILFVYWNNRPIYASEEFSK